MNASLLSLNYGDGTVVLVDYTFEQEVSVQKVEDFGLLCVVGENAERIISVATDRIPTLDTMYGKYTGTSLYADRTQRLIRLNDGVAEAILAGGEGSTFVVKNKEIQEVTHGAVGRRSSIIEAGVIELLDSNPSSRKEAIKEGIHVFSTYKSGVSELSVHDIDVTGHYALGSVTGSGSTTNI